MGGNVCLARVSIDWKLCIICHVIMFSICFAFHQLLIIILVRFYPFIIFFRNVSKVLYSMFFVIRNFSVQFLKIHAHTPFRILHFK